MPILPSFNHSYEYNSSDKDYSGCLSDIYFGNTSYTLSFGHLLSGNLHCDQSLKPVPQCYESRSFELPESYSNLYKNTFQSQQNSISNHKVNEAMKTIRKAIKKVEKQNDYSIPSVPYCYNPIMSNCNQNKITSAALLLGRAANAVSNAANTQNQFQ